MHEVLVNRLGGLSLPRKSVVRLIDRPDMTLNTFVSPSAFSRRAVVSYWRKYVHEVLVNRLGGLSLPRKSVVRLTDRPDMTLDVYRGRKITMQQQLNLRYNAPYMKIRNKQTKKKKLSSVTNDSGCRKAVYLLNSIAHRKAKIVYNFGLSECKRVNFETLLKRVYPSLRNFQAYSFKL